MTGMLCVVERRSLGQNLHALVGYCKREPGDNSYSVDAQIIKVDPTPIDSVLEEIPATEQEVGLLLGMELKQ